VSDSANNIARSAQQSGQSSVSDAIAGPEAFAAFVAAALVSPEPFPLDPLVPQPSDDELEMMRSRFLACFLANHQRFYNTYARLGDRRSKELYLQQLLFRLLGYKLARSPCNTPEYWARRAFCMALPSEPSPLNELLSDIRHFRWQSGTTPLHLDCTYFSILQHHLGQHHLGQHHLGQYHLERPDVVVSPEPGDHVVDIGFFIADVALDFACDVGPSGRVYGFDIVDSHFEIAQHNLAQNPAISNVTLLPAAISDRDQAGDIVSGPVQAGFGISPDRKDVALRTLDSLVDEGVLPRVDFIKMDIEGSELAALRGARRTLAMFRPKLAISLYHRAEDSFAIPEFLTELDLGYRLHFEHYSLNHWETVLYAIAS
jgi:FkbM family methyltransferase